MAFDGNTAAGYYCGGAVVAFVLVSWFGGDPRPAGCLRCSITRNAIRSPTQPKAMNTSLMSSPESKILDVSYATASPSTASFSVRRRFLPRDLVSSLEKVLCL